jgi:hypothetical protein
MRNLMVLSAVLGRGFDFDLNAVLKRAHSQPRKAVAVQQKYSLGGMIQ